MTLPPIANIDWNSERGVSPRLNRDRVGTAALYVYDTAGVFACDAVNGTRSWLGSSMIRMTHTRCARLYAERAECLAAVYW